MPIKGLTVLLYCRSSDCGGGRGNVIRHVKREINCSGGTVRGNMPGGYVQGECWEKSGPVIDEVDLLRQRVGESWTSRRETRDQRRVQ